MAKAYTNVNSTTGTFAGWLSKSNELFYDMSTMIVTVADVSAPNSSNEARTTGNADIQGIFSANNIVVWDTLAGGRNEEWANTDTLYIVSNTQIGNSSQTDTLTVYGDATFDANVQIGSAATDGLTIAANTVVNGLSFFTANTRFNDNVRLSLGTDSDVEFYHNGSDLRLKHNSANTSDFIIEDTDANDIFLFNTASSYLQITRYDGSTMGPSLILRDQAPSANNQYTGKIDFQAADSDGNTVQYARILGYIADSVDGTEDGSISVMTTVAGTNRTMLNVNSSESGKVRLYYANSSSSAVKLNTKVDGVLVSGELESTTLDVNGVADISGVVTLGANANFGDADQANFGAAADLQIFHDASHSHIKDNGTGNLKISSSQIDFLGGADGAETMATMVDDGAVTLYHNNAVKIATTATGVSVTGLVSSTTATSSGLTTADSLSVTNNAAVGGDLTVQGELIATGSSNMTVNNATFTSMSVIGNSDIGDQTSDTVTITARVDSDIVPSTDSARDLGTTSLRWRNAFIDDLTLTANVNLQTRGSALFYDADNSNYVAFKSPATISSNITWTLPDADATTSGFALVSNASGVLSWAAAGATTTSDTTTNANEQIYFGDITSGAVTAVHHDAGLTYNPSTGTLTSDAFAGVASSATTLTGLTSTVTELNKVDGGTAASSITAAGADRVVYNDAGVMKQVALTTLDTYFSGTTKTLTNKTLTSPTLNTPSIGTSFTFDSITVAGIQTSGESFADNNTSLMTSAAINDKIQAVIDADSSLMQLNSAATKTSGDLTFNDNVAINLGSDADAEIYHTGSHLIADINTGDFFIRDGSDSNFTALQFAPTTGDLSIFNNDAAIPGPTITLRHDSPSPAAGDELGQIFFQMDNAAGTNHNYASIDARVVDPTTNSQDGKISLYTAAAGAYVETVKADSGVATLLHLGNAKLATASGGVTITGTATATTFSGSGASLTALPAASLTGTIADARLPASITSDITGNAATATLAADATKLATTRAIQVSGAVTGTANFDGSAAINIVTTATSDPTITLGGDLTGSATLTNLGNATLTATIAATSVETDMIAADAITGAKIADDAINSEHYVSNSIDALHLNVSGNGTTSQFLRSDADGSFTWAVPTDTNTTYTAGTGLDLTGTTFSLETDLRDGITAIGRDANDYIAIGTTNIVFNLDGAQRMSITNAGALITTGDITAFGSLSDIRLKENIEPITNALDKVSQIGGYTFNYKKNPDVRMTGVIAQEVEKVLPEVIYTTTDINSDEENLAVRYENMIGLLVEAIKELKTEVEELKKGK